MTSYFQKIPASTKKPSNRQPGYFAPLPERPPMQPPPHPHSSTPLWPAPYPSPYPQNGGIPPPPGADRMPAGPLPFNAPEPRSTAKTLMQLGRTLAPNDYVEVNLRARGWVLGVVICVCELANAVCSWGYKVRFPSARGGQEEGRFPPEEVRRASPPNSNQLPI